MARKPVTDMSAWPSLTLEGNLIAPAMVAKVDRREAVEQSEEEYGVRKGLTIRDEISTAFRVGQSHFDEFAAKQDPSVEVTRRFVRDFLKETFGFDDLVTADGVVSYLAGGRVPVVVVPPSDALDRRSETLSTDRSRSPAFALQDYLNEEEEALWGLSINGTSLRLMRDNASLTRPAFIEADLAQIFANDDAASFAALWLIIHRSRFGKTGTPATDCALERWRDSGAREGEVARDRLAGQVQVALRVLGSGFLEANPDLASRLQSGEVPLTGWFNELLRLVYRLIFLMVAEDRNLLHPTNADPDGRKLYAEGYGLAALRQQCVRGSTWDRHHDRYEGMKIVFRALSQGQKALALPALGGLFAPDQMPSLDGCRLRNKAFMEAVYRLSWLAGQSGQVPVNWRAMETEELGSVYESLLELQPQLSDDGRQLAFASDAAEQKGNQRKTTGSYYTPDSLVQALLDTALDPVLDKTEEEADNPETALLALSVIDPACGSGHFLLAAARRIATRVARIRAEGTPSLEDFRHALRDVARCCIHGVDRNPMAVELTKVALWIETVDPGLPLGFFDAQIRCGDALLGVFDLKALEDGIPDDAYKALTGGDRETANHFKRRNRGEKEGQGSFDFAGGGGSLPAARSLADLGEKVRVLPEATLADIEAKAKAYQKLRQGSAWYGWKVACDAYVAAFLAPKVGGVPENHQKAMIPTTAHVWDAMEGRMPYGPLVAKIDEIAHYASAFHWPLEFPDVLARGGFDAVLGNPPWERVKLQEKEFFALRDHEIATAKNAAARRRLIAELAETNPRLLKEWNDALHTAAAESHFMRTSGRFPLGGVGDVNTYAVFSDLFWKLLSTLGYAGLIIPTGLVSGFTYREFLGELLRTKSIAAFYGFENEDLIFPHITNKVKFGLLTIAGTEVQIEQPWFTAHIRQPSEIADPEKRYALTIDEIKAINPNTLNLPAFRWAKDAEVTAAIHRAAPILISKNGNTIEQNPWDVSFKRMFDMANDSEHFLDHEDIAPLIQERQGAMALLEDGRKVYPLYEGKMFWHFDHRYGTYEGQTEKQANKGVLPRVTDEQHADPAYSIESRYWVDAQLTDEALETDADRKWFYAWRDVGPSERTLVGTVVPKSAFGHASPIMLSTTQPEEFLTLSTLLSSLVVDYAVRQKSNRMTFFIIEQLPVLTPSFVQKHVDWLGGTVIEWFRERAVELMFTNTELQGLASSLGRDHAPYKWDQERRCQLQAEIDAAAIHLYGLSKPQADWLLDSFTVLRKYEERDHDEFRTKRLVLAAYDAMAEAQEKNSVFVSGLNPGPADPSLCHPAAFPASVDMPSLSALPDGAWSWPMSVEARDRLRYAAQYVLWLKGSDKDGSRTRFLIVGLAEPALLTAILTGSEKADWIRLVGPEAQPGEGVIRLRQPVNEAWRSMFEVMLSSGQLEERDDGDWGRGRHFDPKGLRVDSIDAQRAAFAIEAIRDVDIERLKASIAEEDNVIWTRFGHGGSA